MLPKGIYLKEESSIFNIKQTDVCSDLIPFRGLIRCEECECPAIVTDICMIPSSGWLIKYKCKCGYIGKTSKTPIEKILWMAISEIETMLLFSLY